ncbi:peptidoglycan DD-metalloendopeptidase family protein [Aquimarina sp. U1-2]|uniref:M23 family metallopeptidase n=1 Tax=Aquimarina sp. U1-2 TaxID=2823141 RepID=UPI001AECAA1C|nr:M23 family metallopeptidase [Aquimarina sp. U1-2]MBP2833519.1 peptidoglycan DD-metalloendopeptidase family protein [Aquimarina sp. U1-2]
MFFIVQRQVSYIVMAIFWLLVMTSQSYSQQSSRTTSIHHYEKLFINGKTLQFPVYSNSISNNKPALDFRKIHQQDFEKYWDNVRFNPYYGENVSIPFQLDFDEKKFSSPVDKKMVVTSRYGWRKGRPHHGIDIDLWVGDSVRSILPGKVRYVGYHGGHGNTVIVRHYNGLETVYAHLSKFLVKENDEVKSGQPIAKGGITGNARGSHLHLEVRYHGKSINPEYLFDFTDKTPVRSNVFMVTRKWTTPHYHRSNKKSRIVVHTSLQDIDLYKEEQKKIYTVKKGDTLYRIANRHGIAITEICKINAIRKNQVLKIGQQLIVSAAQ